MPQQQKTKRYNSTVILEENRSNLEVTEELLWRAHSFFSTAEQKYMSLWQGIKGMFSNNWDSV